MKNKDLTITPRKVIWKIISSVRVFITNSCGDDIQKQEEMEKNLKEIEAYIKVMPAANITEVLGLMKAKFPKEAKLIDLVEENSNEL